MNRFVLDASVALKWVIPPANETLSAESLQLLQEYVNGKVDFLVPDIFWAEVGTWYGKVFGCGDGPGRLPSALHPKCRRGIFQRCRLAH